MDSETWYQGSELVELLDQRRSQLPPPPKLVEPHTNHKGGPYDYWICTTPPPNQILATPLHWTVDKGQTMNLLACRLRLMLT